MLLQGSLPQAVTPESSSPSLETIEASARLAAGWVGQDDLVPRAVLIKSVKVLLNLFLLRSLALSRSVLSQHVS